MNNIDEKRKHVLKYFSDLEFDAEQHKYNHKERQLCSVSSAIKKSVEPFDADRIAGFVAKKRGVSKQDILQEWEDKKNEACDKGDRIHQFGENFKTYNLKPTDGYEQAVVNFWDSIPEYIEPFLHELKMFSNELGIAGTADLILYNNKTEKFIIVDYKTNIDLFKNYRGKKMLEPFNEFLDSPFNKYQVQLSYYQYLFEQCGFEVEDKRIIWLKPDGTFETFKTENLTNLILKKHELEKS